MMENIEAGLVVPERIVPWPASISQAARNALIETAQLNYAAGTMQYPDPADGPAWRGFIEQMNEILLVALPLVSVAERPGIKSETTQMSGVTVHISTPDTLDAAVKDSVYLEIHGGGLVLLGGEACRRGGLRFAEILGMRTMSVDYGVPPDRRYPAGLDDCLAVYRALLKDYSPQRIIVGGISGGSNLAAALPLRARDEGLPLPGALALLTPELDLTESGDTFETLMGIDPVLTARLTTQIEAYAPGQDLTHPYLSPLFGDFTRGYPSTFLQSGTRDLFLSNAVRMHRKLLKAGIAAELHVWEAMPHGAFSWYAPEDEEVSQELRRFVRAHLVA
jgi:epsilon-lactone hydrolase